jgi:hypothetical protein
VKKSEAVIGKRNADVTGFFLFVVLPTYLQMPLKFAQIVRSFVRSFRPD